MMKQTFKILITILIIFSCIAAVPMVDPSTDDPVGRKEVEEWSESFQKFLDVELPHNTDMSIYMRCSEIIETKAKESSSMSNNSNSSNIAPSSD